MYCKHYYPFESKLGVKNTEDKLDASDWDSMRTADVEGTFTIEKDRESWEKNCKNEKNYEECAQLIVEGIKADTPQRIVSLGIGKGILEYYLKKLRPDWIIDGADYASKSIETLKRVFENHDKLFCFDMLRDDYWDLKKYDHLIMYRVSTEFDREQWKNIFKKMAWGG